MNAAIRKQLQTLLEAIDTGPLSTLKEELETIRDAEQEKLEAVPEPIQAAGGAMVTQMQDSIDALDEAISELDTAIASVEQVQDHITTAQGAA